MDLQAELIKAKPQPKIQISPPPTAEPVAQKPLPKGATPRQKLEALAAGDMGALAETGESSLPREQVNELLTQTGEVLLEVKDTRVLLAALARASSDSRLGNALRRDSVRMIASLDPEMVPEALRPRLEELKTKSAPLLARAGGKDSEFADFLSEYSQKNPDRAVPPGVIDSLRQGLVNTPELVAQAIGSDPTLKEALLTELGISQGQLSKPEGVIASLGLAATPETISQASFLFAPKASERPIQTMIFPSILAGGLTLMFLSHFMSSQGESKH